ncbi:TIGR02281 family clan AA aspartic protease [Pseudomaricurvus sp. HS19]|uniref:retropepsin-like aspartic protease family protein n=1 Tax=Pseudomaricurvus sp. HS19 TaxID=2692626 RepID=UPI00136A12F3|nr:retropepsin-like aspartic protease [Pseudomaricurvus sp. HS19]MYM64716.1 TIGR02281 family clan AA aspartic protease [Pseudomaricurvus sp. HS19]
MSDYNPDTSKRLGRHMLWIFWLLALGVMTWIFGNWEESRINPNTDLSAVAGTESGSPTGVIEITLEANHQHHFVASGKINGKPVTFILDTGATEVIVPKSLSSLLGLTPGSAKQAMTANGTVTVYATRINSLELGPIHLEDVPASINQGMKGGQILLGMSALRQLELSLQDGQMVLRQYR